jgi:hypothetical protein
VTTDRVCKTCNSALGRVDAALNNFLPIRTRRAKLGLAGNVGEPPAWYEIFLGVATQVGAAANRVKTTFNKVTGMLETQQLYHATDVLMPDGKKVRQITIDARDKGQIPTIIKRERARHGMPPLSEEQLADAAKIFTTTVVENPVLQLSISVSFAYLRHAMMKIAYELAFLWLGEAYLDDPLAAELRAAIIKPDLTSTDSLSGYVGDAQGCPAFNFWTPHEAHHLAFASVVPNNVTVSVRVFDIYAAIVVVSKEPNRYFQGAADLDKLRFLVIDAITRKTLCATFADESRRLSEAMSANRRLPPFADPLSPS